MEYSSFLIVEFQRNCLYHHHTGGGSGAAAADLFSVHIYLVSVQISYIIALFDDVVLCGNSPMMVIESRGKGRF